MKSVSDVDVSSSKQKGTLLMPHVASALPSAELADPTARLLILITPQSSLLSISHHNPLTTMLSGSCHIGVTTLPYPVFLISDYSHALDVLFAHVLQASHHNDEELAVTR